MCLLLALALVVPASPVQNPWAGPEGTPAPIEAPATVSARAPTPGERERCLAALDEELPGALELADLSRSLEVNRTHDRQADLNETTSLLLKALGWVPGVHGNLTDVQDSTEVETLTCRFEQRVNLEERNVLSALALRGRSPGSVGPREAANITLVLEIKTVTENRFRLDEDTVLSAMALSPEGFDPARVNEIAVLERTTRTDRTLRQEVVIDPDTALLALAGSDPRKRTQA